MSEPVALIPPPAKATASGRKRIPVAFGPRFFILLIIGLGWLGPALINVQFLYVMLVWDLLLLAVWGVELARLRKPTTLPLT